MPLIPPHKPPPAFSDDQRKQILDELSGPGVTHPPYVPRWQFFIAVFVKITVVGWLYIYALVPVTWMGDDATGLLLSLLAIFAWFAGGIWLVAKVLRPAMQRWFAAARWGNNAAHAVMKAKIAPVLYLRSFKFDAVARHTPALLRLLTRELTATPEMILVDRLAQATPVLAIGRPGESDPPPGALRFWVEQDLWQQKVSRIVTACSLVVWTTGHTDGLDWEIRYIIGNVPATRVLMWVHSQFARSEAERSAEWLKFAERYKDVFPKPLPTNVRGARFVAFDEQWAPILIPGAEYPTSLGERVLWLGGAGSTFGLAKFTKNRLG